MGDGGTAVNYGKVSPSVIGRKIKGNLFGEKKKNQKKKKRKPGGV